MQIAVPAGETSTQRGNSGDECTGSVGAEEGPRQGASFRFFLLPFVGGFIGLVKH